VLKRDEDAQYRQYVPFLNSDYNLYLLIYLTHAALFNARYSEIKVFGITSMELALLTVVQGLGESATPAEISRWMMRKRPTISGLLNRMERNGLITRTGFKTNKKLTKVSMTSKGQEALDRASKHDVLHAIIGAISEEEYKQLWSLLEKLKDAAISAAE
jgi:DNA-binding MarR family transcriptional regulator